MDRNQYGWNENDLKLEFDLAVSLGWVKMMQDAAAEFQLQPKQLLALTSRETGPFWHSHQDGNIVGDHGKAFCLSQLNSDAIPDAANYATPEKCIPFTAKLLAGNELALRRKLGTASPGPIMLNRLLYASWNRGVHGAMDGFQVSNPDLKTAHGNYSLDCQAREDMFDKLLAESTQGPQPVIPATDTGTVVAQGAE